jgi:hemerythrin superfamily protein
MDALKLLTEQHDEVDELIESIEQARKGDRKRALFAEMADKLAAHAAMEEKLFYPAVKVKKTEDMILESTEEHLAIKRVLADMLALDVEDEHFDAKLSVLKEEVAHHAREEEEKELFPKVRQLLDKAEREQLGEEMESLFETILAQSPRKDVPSETEHAAQIP